MDKFIEIINESKKAKTTTPVNELSQYRWSPRSFQKKSISKEQMMSILEAARWSASAFNEQPWRFIVGFNGDETFEKIFNTLGEWNQNWAKNASALILNIYKKSFTHNDKPNGTAIYDLGQAVASYSLEVVNQGLHSHQMGGYDGEKADEIFKLGNDFASICVTAVGHLEKPDALPEDLFKIELQNRIRKGVNQIAFIDVIDKTPFSL
jgi:nitroreductase